MNPFALSGLLILITSISMGVFVFIKTPNNPTNRIWVYFTVTVAWWGLGALVTGETKNPTTSLIWWNIANIGVIYIAVLFSHFVHRFLEIENKRFILISYIIGIFFTATIFCGQFIKNVSWFFNSFYYGGNPPTLLFVIFFILWSASIIYSHILLYQAMQKVSHEKRNQIKYFFLATLLGYSGGTTAFLPSLGINIYPYGNFAIALYPLVMTYAISKYNLMDISIVIRRSLVYSLVITTITLIFLLCIFISEYLFHQALHYHNIAESILIVCLFTFIFTPIKNSIQNLVDRAFFRATPMEIATQNEKLKAVATLASGLAHEIKNPLTILKTFAEFVPLKKNDPQFMEQYQRIIPQEIERIDSLVRELLYFAKPSIPQIQTLNSNEIIQNILLMLHQKLESSNIKVITELNSHISIQADPNQLKQALLNIILNAIDAMPNGGTLSVRTHVIPNSSFSVIPAKGRINRHSQLLAGIQDHQYIIEISDTGCGIHPKDLPHIFEPFFTKKEKGTGLGLAITQGIIEKHDGLVSVISKINKGTTFIIKIPYEPILH